MLQPYCDKTWCSFSPSVEFFASVIPTRKNLQGDKISVLSQLKWQVLQEELISRMPVEIYGKYVVIVVAGYWAT